MFRIDRSRVNLSSVQDMRANAGDPVLEVRPEEAVIPAQSVPNAAGEVASAKIIENARKEAEYIREQAKHALSKAVLDAQAMQISARQLGYEEGMAEARREYAEMAAKNKESLCIVISEIQQKSQEMYDNLEGDIVDLCFAVVKKLADMDRAGDGSFYKSMIRKALGQMEITNKLSVHVCAEDCERFFPDGEVSFPTGDGIVTATVQDAPELGSGDIIIENGNETVTAGLETQMKSIELVFRQLLGKNNEYN